ncbi:hypothetical protein Tco_0016097 [Tanacetum coccineum]
MVLSRSSPIISQVLREGEPVDTHVKVQLPSEIGAIAMTRSRCLVNQHKGRGLSDSSNIGLKTTIPIQIPKVGRNGVEEGGLGTSPESDCKESI